MAVFYAKMAETGVILVPKLTLMQGDKPSFAGYVIDVTLEPAEHRQNM